MSYARTSSAVPFQTQTSLYAPDFGPTTPNRSGSNRLHPIFLDLNGVITGLL